MKYIMEIPPKADFVTAYYMEDGLPVMYKSDRIDDLEPYTESDRKAIEDEVWEFIRTCLVMKGSDFVEVFDSHYSHALFQDYSYQEAKTRYEAWLKQKDEIKVGDEIVGIYSDGEKTPPLVVLKVEGNYYYGIYSKTGEFVQGGLNYEKTGRHFTEVAELLKKMRGDSDGTET